MATATGTVRLRLQEYHPGQARLVSILNHPAVRYVVAPMGRKWGKTSLGVNYLAEKLVCEQTWHGMPWQAFWVAPTYKLALIGHTRLLDTLGDRLIHRQSRQEFLVEALGHNRCWWRSSDNPTGLVGEDLDLVIFDECSRAAEHVWFRELAPNLTARRGKALFISTPHGRNWFHRLYRLGISTEEAHRQWVAATCPTVGSYGNPYVDAAEVELARQVMPEDFFRENYLAEFLAESAGVFRGVRRCVYGELRAPERKHVYVVGFDTARYQDWSVLTVLDATTRPYAVVGWERRQGQQYEEQVRRAAELADRYNGAYVTMDATHGSIGDPMLEELRKIHPRSGGYYYTGVSKQELVQRLILAIENREVVFPEIPQLLNELEAFEYELTPAGNVRYGVQTGWNDDAVNSLALAVVAADSNAQPARVRMLDDPEEDD